MQEKLVAILVIAILQGVASIQHGKEREFICPGDGSFPIPGECSGNYYFCNDGIASPTTCPGNGIFDPVALLCVNPEQASCERCNNYLTTDAGVVLSPSFPNNYAANEYCLWRISAPPGKYIRLTFSVFLLEPNADFVQIFDGLSTASPLLLRRSGFEIPDPVVSSSNDMLIQMTSNAATQYAGFNATYVSIATGTTQQVTTSTTRGPTTPIPINCGGALFGNGIFRSPNYPKPYDSNTNCTWLLQSSAQFISLNFTFFVTEFKVDFLDIWEGWDTATDPALKLYGNLTDNLPSYRSATGNKLALRFISDDSIEHEGFEAEFY